MTTNTGIEYDYKKAIRQEGRIVGWHLYSRSGGMLGAHKFVGYLWKKARIYTTSDGRRWIECTGIEWDQLNENKREILIANAQHPTLLVKLFEL